VALPLALLACLPVDVTTEAVPGTNIAQLATFVQTPPPAPEPTLPRYTQEIGTRVQQEIARALQAKGYRLVEEGPDFEVAFVVSKVRGERLVDAGDPDANYEVLQPYVDGTLTILLRDPESKRLLWQGSGETQVFTGGALGGTDPEFVAVESTRKVLERLPAHAPTP
jgi:hypothetical protein